jgi:hypothetical protein
MSKYFDMTSYAQKYMAQAIAKAGLTVTSKGGDMVWLQNDDCQIQLQNIDNDYVRFEFCSPSKPEELWEFADYLDCQFEGRGMQLRPLPPRDFDAESKFVFMLEKYNELLLGGYFDIPLSGDFTWAPKYLAHQAEYRRLGIERGKLGRQGHPEAEAILDKKLAGDPTWMDDVRRILAEQGS